MDLNTLWFVLIAILFTGYFVLEGFDLGVGILLPFLGKSDLNRRVLLNTIGPHWDGNEVWLITAGGAMFAAFPVWYGTLFSGFYLPLFLILLALIFRGIAIEFRSLDSNPRWRSLWDAAFFAGSLVPALLWGVAFANFVRGVPISADLFYAGGFWNLLNPFALAGGLVSLTAFTLHGAIFLTLKTTGELREQSYRTAWRAWIPNVLALLVFVFLFYFQTDVLQKIGVNPGLIPIAAVAALFLVGYFIRRRREGWAFGMMTASIAFSILTLFIDLYPRLLISTLDPAWSLTIYNAASSPYTLRAMTIVTAIFLPIVLAYQAWSYWVFRKRVSPNPERLHY